MSQLALFADPAAKQRKVAKPPPSNWRCLYCRRGYVAAIDYQPDAAACPACGADLEETP